MNSKSKPAVSDAAAALEKDRAPSIESLGQLAFFDEDGAILEQALVAADELEAQTASIVSRTPDLAAQLAEPGAKERLDFARFMRAATAPAESVREALTDGADAVLVNATMEQLETVERVAAKKAPARRRARAKDADDAKGASGTSLYLAKLRKNSRYSPPTPEREAELGRRSLAGDLQARTELVERNMGFMVKVAASFLKTGRPFDDLLQAGSEGLMTAAAKFNPELGRFTTVAAWWIRQAIQRAVHRDSNMPMPAYLPGYEARLLKMADEAETEEERAALKVKAAGAAKHFQALRSPAVSLDQSNDDEDGGHDLLSLIASEEPGHEERAERMQLMRKIMELSGRLGDPRATTIFLMRVGMHPDFPGEIPTLAEMSEKFNCTRERVRQIYAKAAEDIATAMEYWAQGAHNLPDGFRESLVRPRGA